MTGVVAELPTIVGAMLVGGGVLWRLRVWFASRAYAEEEL